MKYSVGERYKVVRFSKQNYENENYIAHFKNNIFYISWPEWELRSWKVSIAKLS